MCEDYPCCGHDICPDYENGRQINMKCTCGATVPLDSRSSLCQSCLNMPSEDDFYPERDDFYPDRDDFYPDRDDFYPDRDEYDPAFDPDDFNEAPYPN